MRFVYNVLFGGFFVLSLPYYFWRLWRRGNWRSGVGQRFGWYGPEVVSALDGDRKVIWFHAVSVGEVNLCALLVRVFAEQRPDYQIVVSTTTTTGMGELQRKLPETVLKIYYPIDFSYAVKRALRLVRPDAFVLVEAEIWPNLIWRLRDRGTPMFLVNARLSDRSARRYRKVGWLFRSIFGSFSGVGVQNEADAAALERVGCRADRVHVTGNLKFDAVQLASEHRVDPAAILRWAGAQADSLVLLGSSTHAGEERLLAERYLRLRERFPKLFLVLVPRHFERAKDVVKELDGLGLRLRLRSEFEEEPPSVAESDAPGCLLVNSTGELRDFYSIADMVFIGKSLLAHGGQNPIEPAAAGKAVVMGPYMENFRAIVRTFLDAESMLQVADADALEAALADLSEDDAARARLGARAQDVVMGNRGAVERTVGLILGQLVDGEERGECKS